MELPLIVALYNVHFLTATIEWLQHNEIKQTKIMIMVTQMTNEIVLMVKLWDCPTTG